MALSKQALMRVVNSVPEGDDVGVWVVGVCRAVESEVRKQDDALLAEARAELHWWIDEHRCCAGHEEDLLDRLDARLQESTP